MPVKDVIPDVQGVTGEVGGGVAQAVELVPQYSLLPDGGHSKLIQPFKNLALLPDCCMPIMGKR